MAIESLDDFGLRCFLSRSASADSMLGPPARQAALDFYRVLEEIFQQTAIIPFRFPTVLADEAEMSAHLSEHAAEYQPALVRLRDKVQMEIQIGFQESPPTAKMADASGRQSGTQYLLGRRNQQTKFELAAQMLHQAGRPWIGSWRQRNSMQGVRCFGLVGRAFVTDFQQALRKVQLAPELTARVTGPWPATEFLKEE